MKDWWGDRVTNGAAAPAPRWQLGLYVAGTLGRLAPTNLRLRCKQRLDRQDEPEVIDSEKYPQLARREQLRALPLLVRRAPGPRRGLAGDLSYPAQLLRSLIADAGC